MITHMFGAVISGANQKLLGYQTRCNQALPKMEDWTYQVTKREDHVTCSACLASLVKSPLESEVGSSKWWDRQRTNHVSDEYSDLLIHEVYRNNNVEEPQDVKCESAATGVWFVYGTDTYDFPLFVSDEEIIALRWVVNNRVHQPRVMFWEFGVDWNEMNKREIDKRRARGELQ